MTYLKQVWSDLPSKATPITAARLGHLETQYDEAVAAMPTVIAEVLAPTLETAADEAVAAALIRGPRKEVILTTATSLDTGGRETGVISIAAAYRLLRIELSSTARLRLYVSEQHRDNDLNRPRSTELSTSTDHGVILDLAAPADALARTPSPLVDGMTLAGDEGVAYTLDNLGTPGVITATITYLREE